MRHAFVIALSIAAASAVGAAAQTAQSSPSSQQQQQTAAGTQQQNVTITGCVAAGPNNTYTVTSTADTAARDATTGTTATTPAGSKVVKTITYTVSGSKLEDLKREVGHTVQVSGVESAPEAVAAVTDRTAAPAPQGTSGSTAGAKPQVVTTAQAEIVVRNLSVNAVKVVSNSCSLVK